MEPFIELISNVLGLYNICVIAWAIIGLLISFEIINGFSPIVKKVKLVLDRLIEPVIAPIRRFMRKTFGDMGGIDLSPIVLILLIQFAQSALYSWFV